MRQSMRVGFAVLLVIGVLGVLQPAWGQEVTSAIVGTLRIPAVPDYGRHRHGYRHRTGNRPHRQDQ